MSKNKKIITAVIFIILLMAIALGIYNVCTSYLFDENNSIPDGKGQVINKVKETNDIETKRNMIEFSIEYNIITQEEASKLF